MVGDSKDPNDKKFYVAGISNGRLPCNPNSVSVYYPAYGALDNFYGYFLSHVCGSSEDSFMSLNSVSFLLLLGAGAIALVNLVLLCCICCCCCGCHEHKTPVESRGSTPVERRGPNLVESKAHPSGRVQSKPTAVPATVPVYPVASPAKSKDSLAKMYAKSSQR